MTRTTTPQDETQDRHGGRAVPWKAIVACAAIALAGFLLHRTLAQYSYDEIVSSVTGVPQRRLLLAGAFAAASYLCLTGFDWLALRYVEKPLPYPRAALASFVALSLGHNIGFAALSSGTIRYRFYSRWGLTAEEIAKLVLFCGLTVGLGLAVLGGVALLARPALASEMTGLGLPAVITLGGACIAAVAGYLALAAWVRTPLRFRRWSLQMPPLRLALAQVGIGALNFACVAACLHQAILAAADAPYLNVAAVYVIANTAAIVSHVPGGLGVIESVVSYLIPGAVLVGPLLVFRFVYFLGPLMIGGAVLAAAELVFRSRGRPDTSATA